MQNNFIQHKTQTEQFKIIPMSITMDYSLSAKAFGLLVKMLMLPPDWNFTEVGLSKLVKDSRDGIRSGLKELEDAGYLIRVRVRDDSGKLRHMEYHIYETPVKQQDKPVSEKPTLEETKPVLENTTLEKSMQVSAHNLITNNLNIYLAE